MARIPARSNGPPALPFQARAAADHSGNGVPGNSFPSPMGPVCRQPQSVYSLSSEMLLQVRPGGALFQQMVLLVLVRRLLLLSRCRLFRAVSAPRGPQAACRVGARAVAGRESR